MITEAQSLQPWQEIIKAQLTGWNRNSNIASSPAPSITIMIY